MWATGWWRGRARGFTLLELIIVVAILALFWSAAGLRIEGAVSGGDLRLAGRKLMGEVRELRGKAAATHREHVLHLDLGRGRYWSQEASAEEGAQAFGWFPEAREQVQMPENARSLPRGVSVTEVRVPARDPMNEGRAEIRFRENGTVERAWIHLENEKDRSITLEIHPVTGRVEVHEGRVDEQTV